MLLPAMAYIDIEYVERYKAKAKGKESEDWWYAGEAREEESRM